MNQGKMENGEPKNWLDTAVDWISRFMMMLCVLIFGVMVFAVSYGVIGRYLPFVRNPRWTQELATLCMVWLCFLSAGYAIKNGLHVRMTIVSGLLPKKAQRFLTRLAYALLLAVNLFFIVYGIQLMHLTRRARMSATGWPMKIMYLSVVIGGIYGACMSLYRVLKGGEGK